MKKLQRNIYGTTGRSRRCPYSVEFDCCLMLCYEARYLLTLEVSCLRDDQYYFDLIDD